jgi:hypothetical protein
VFLKIVSPKGITHCHEASYDFKNSTYSFDFMSLNDLGNGQYEWKMPQKPGIHFIFGYRFILVNFFLSNYE